MRSILRLLAVACVLAACAIVWLPTSEHRLLVVAIDAARLSEIERLARDGSLPTFAKIIDSSRTLQIVGGSRRAPRAYWRAVFAMHDGGALRRHVWDAAAESGLDVAVVGIPGTEEAETAALKIVPGAQEEGGFIGDNAGTIVRAGEAQTGMLPWPYEGAAPDVAEAIRHARPDQWSDWILLEMPAPDSRRGFFRLRASGESEYFASPVYRRGTPAGRYAAGLSPRLLYVPDDPVWAAGLGLSPDLLYSHAREITEARAETAARLAAAPHVSLVVCYESLLALVEQLEPVASDRMEPARLERQTQAYREIDRRIGRMLMAGGRSYDVVVIGREPDEQDGVATSKGRTRGSTGFIAWSPGAKRPFATRAGAGLRAERVAMGALAMARGSAGRPASPGILVARASSREEQHPQAPSPRAEKRGARERARGFSSGALRKLGLLTASSVATPERRDSVSEVAQQ